MVGRKLGRLGDIHHLALPLHLLGGAAAVRRRSLTSRAESSVSPPLQHRNGAVAARLAIRYTLASVGSGAQPLLPVVSHGRNLAVDYSWPSVSHSDSTQYLVKGGPRQSSLSNQLADGVRFSAHGEISNGTISAEPSPPRWPAVHVTVYLPDSTVEAIGKAWETPQKTPFLTSHYLLVTRVAINGFEPQHLGSTPPVPIPHGSEAVERVFLLIDVVTNMTNCARCAPLRQVISRGGFDVRIKLIVRTTWRVIAIHLGLGVSKSMYYFFRVLGP